MTPTAAQPPIDLAALYEVDEVAWLDETAQLVTAGRWDEIDAANLAEYLTDMGISHRREIESRLTVLLHHVLKWVYQPEKRTPSWQVTILTQKQDLRRWVATGVLRRHAIDVLDELYPDAVALAMAETQKPATDFPSACPFTLDELMTFDPNAGDRP